MTTGAQGPRLHLGKSQLPPNSDEVRPTEGESRCRNHSRTRGCRCGWVRTSSYQDSTAYSRQKLTPAVPCCPLHLPLLPPSRAEASVCTHFEHHLGLTGVPTDTESGKLYSVKVPAWDCTLRVPQYWVGPGKIMPQFLIWVTRCRFKLCVLCPGSIAFLRGGGRAEARAHSCTPTISAYPALLRSFLEKEWE